MFERLACRAAKAKGRILVGLEIWSSAQPAIDAFLASTGESQARQALLAHPFWHREDQDGRSSRAMLQLLDALRQHRAAGLDLVVKAIDPEHYDSAIDRDARMATTVGDAIESFQPAQTLILVGDVHARLLPGHPWDPSSPFVSVGARLKDQYGDVIGLHARSRGGSAWMCLSIGESPPKCGEHSWRGGTVEGSTPRFVLEPGELERSGWSGTLFLAAVRASPPAAQSEGPVDWGVEQDGVRTGLYALSDQVSLDQPMYFGLVMENVGKRTIRFDAQQVAVNESMSIQGEDGADVPYVLGGVQTAGMGDLPTLDPGQRIYLFDVLDITDQYLITSPGTYAVRFKGQDASFGDVAIPASNAVTIRVSDAPIPPSRTMAKKLFDLAQASGWTFSTSRHGDVVPFGRTKSTGASFSLRRSRPTKHGGPAVRIWVVPSPSAVEPESREAQLGYIAEPIGSCPWGEVYLWANAEAADEVSTVHEAIVAALEIEPPQNAPIAR